MTGLGYQWKSRGSSNNSNLGKLEDIIVPSVLQGINNYQKNKKDSGWGAE